MVRIRFKGDQTKGEEEYDAKPEILAIKGDLVDLKGHVTGIKKILGKNMSIRAVDAYSMGNKP